MFYNELIPEIDLSSQVGTLSNSRFRLIFLLSLSRNRSSFRFLKHAAEPSAIRLPPRTQPLRPSFPIFGAKFSFYFPPVGLRSFFCSSSIKFCAIIYIRRNYAELMRLRVENARNGKYVTTLRFATSGATIEDKSMISAT